MDKIDSSVFLDRVHLSLGELANACLDAYEKYGNNRLQEAAYAMKAIQCVDLKKCFKCEDPSPLPWHTDANLDNNSNVPIEDANGNGVIVTDSGYYPPDNSVCESIVSCMNTVYALQQKATESEKGFEKVAKAEYKPDDPIVKMVIDVIKSHYRLLKDSDIDLDNDFDKDLGFDHLDMVECIMELEVRIQEMYPETLMGIPDDETDEIRTVGDMVLCAKKVIEANTK